MTELVCCRICKYDVFTEVVNLGNQVITSRFPKKGDNTTPSGLIRLVMCNNCQLVQLKDSTPASEMYEHFYGYRSGINETMRNHLSNFNNELQNKVTLSPGDNVLDIGSNDCTFINNYPTTVTKYGCDPTGIQFNEFYIKSGTSLIPTYFTKKAINSRLGEIVFKTVTSISMFYDLPDPVKFAEDIYSILDDEGVWALEQSYAKTMLERNSIDTICHEHLEYYGVKQVKDIMDRAGFKIIDISLNECNGGSFRTYVAKKKSVLHKENIDLLNTYLRMEEESGIHTVERYKKFTDDCRNEVEKLVKFINIAKSDNKQTYIYGASTKGNCLLQYADIDVSLIPYAVERNLLKVGRTTSTGIEIISEETMRANPPSFMLVLPWHFCDEIIKREKIYLENGGQLIFPFPAFEIYSNKDKTLITGINGQIGSYLEKQLEQTDCVYGISSKPVKINNSLRIHFDLLNTEYLEYIIKLIKPVRIVHLASITNTEDCENNPIKTIDINGRLTAIICDIIYRNNIKCKLFNASSSDLYKGHNEYVIKEDDVNMAPTSIYSYSKMLGHKIIDTYRMKYNLPYSNGIIFTTESPLRNHKFLIKKVATHAKNYKANLEILSLGGLESWRNINHAEDIARAIVIILNQPKGDNYLVCGNNFNKVSDLVIDIYKRFDIELEISEDRYIDKKTKETVIKIGEIMRGSVTRINGSQEKLQKLGWIPKYDTQALLDDVTDKS